MTDNTRSHSRRPWMWLLIVPFVIGGAVVAGRVLHPRPSVVLITIDTQRPDRIGAYGHRKNATPALDRLAGEGTLFETAYCDIPWTTGSMSSVMTGQYASSHGVQVPTAKLRPEAVTLAEVLRAEGYQTAAVVGSFPLDSVYGLDQGFETYDDEFDLPIYATDGFKPGHVESHLPEDTDEQSRFLEEKFRNDAYRSDEGVTDAAIGWLKLRSGDRRPFFLWVHYFGPHEKLRADVGFAAQEPSIVAAYDADVEATDRAVGRFLDEMRASKLLDQSLVIVHSDHGQNLGEHDYVGHGIRLDEASVRIPMIMRYPDGFPAGTRRADVARNVDLAPTVLAVTGGEAPGLVGRSLLPMPGDPQGAMVPPERQIAYFGTLLPTFFKIPVWVPKYATVLGPVHREGLRTQTWRYISDQVVGPCSHGKTAKKDSMGGWSLPDATPLDTAVCENLTAHSLYAVSAIGDREPDVSPHYPEVVTELTELLNLHASLKASLASPLTLSAEQEEKLRSLGYLK